jgi:beige protein homolog 1
MRRLISGKLQSLANFMIGIVKRFLDALKAETFTHEVFPSFMEALTSLVKCTMTAEVFRSLALFITYAYHKPNSASRTPKNQSGTLPSRSGTISAGPRRPTVSTLFDGKDVVSTTLTKRQLGNKVLEMYSDLLCDKENNANIQKFARTVTNKVRSLTT